MQGTIITNKGLRLITKLVASQGALTFTRAAVGTGKVPEGYDPAGMTGLSHFQMDGKISSYRATGDIAAIVFQVQSVGITQGFTITEAGIYADDPDEGEVLYAYLDMSEDPQYIYAENSAVSKFVEMTLETVIGRVEKITAVINPYHLITREGDISNTVVETMEPSTVEFPEPSAGEKTGVIFGKIKKCIADFKAMKNTLITLSHLVNDGLTTEPGYAADARQLNPNLQGTLAARVAQLNSGINNISMKRCVFGSAKFSVLSPTGTHGVKEIAFVTPYNTAPDHIFIISHHRNVGVNQTVVSFNVMDIENTGFSVAYTIDFSGGSNTGLPLELDYMAIWK